MPNKRSKKSTSRSESAKKAINARWERSWQRTEEDEPVGVVNDLTPSTSSLSAFNQDVAIDSIEEMRVDLPKIYTQSDMDKVATSLIARSTDLEEELKKVRYREQDIIRGMTEQTLRLQEEITDVIGEDSVVNEESYILGSNEDELRVDDDMDDGY